MDWKTMNEIRLELPPEGFDAMANHASEEASVQAAGLPQSEDLHDY